MPSAWRETQHLHGISLRRGPPKGRHETTPWQRKTREETVCAWAKGAQSAHCARLEKHLPFRGDDRAPEEGHRCERHKVFQRMTRPSLPPTPASSSTPSRYNTWRLKTCL